MAAPVMTACFLRFASVFLCILGILIAFYAYQVKTAKEVDPEYVALCDLHEKISCTKVLGSSYAKGFGVLGRIFGETSLLNQSNSIYGIVFYLIHIFLDLRLNVQLTQLQVVMGVAANFMSLYLAYLLMFVLHDLCLVCVTTYLINALLLVCDIIKLKSAQKLTTSKPKIK